MTRTIYLAVFSNGARPAHWSIFIPAADTGLVGKIIHVTGNKAIGFYLEFKRNYDFESEERRYQLIPLTQIDTKYIVDAPSKGGESKDTTARDRIESAATVVPPPGRSANPFDPAALNCQYWLGKYLEQLIEEGIADESANSVLETAPRKL